MIFFSSSRKKNSPPKSSSCTGKSKMTESIARAKVSGLRKRGSKMYAYKCSYCKFPSGKTVWHIGHRR